MIQAKIIADSISPADKRITTMLLVYPRFIHSEVMTHRALSKNAASSRAIPVKKMIDAVRTNPALPVSWGKNQSGMQAKEALTPDQAKEAEAAWREAANSAILHAEKLMAIGAHKQIANRVLEPFMHMTTLLTATEWENFFALRAHEDAQPEFHDLAFAILQAYMESSPVKLAAGEWHVPFGDQLPPDMSLEDRLKIATARCARTSYVSFDAAPDFPKDISLHDKLAESGHWSPFEHCAEALSGLTPSGNFVGWRQYRKLFPNENRSIDLKTIAPRSTSHS